MRKYCTVILLLSTVFCSCNKIEPVTDAEAKTTAESLEKAARNRKADILENIFDVRLLKQNIRKQNENISKSDADKFLTPDAFNEFAKQVMASIKGGSYRLLRIYDDKGKKHMLFRMFGDGGLNYHDYNLVKVNGNVRAEDLFNYVTGENISKTFADFLIPNGGSSINFNAEAGQKFIEINNLKKSHKYRTEINLIKTLDTSISNTKGVQLLYIDAARQMGDNDEYKAALEKFATRYPDATNIYLLMLDVYFLNKEFDKALVAVDKLDSLVQGDPVLNLFRGNIYKELGKKEESMASFEKCFAYDPFIKNNMQMLVAAYADAGQYDKARAAIEKYKQKPEFYEDDIAILYTLYPSLKQ